jgi:hypothetical protein
VRALIGIDSYLMAAAIVRATDQEAANASGAHLCEGDLQLARGLGHAPSFRRSRIKGTLPISVQGIFFSQKETAPAWGDAEAVGVLRDLRCCANNQIA